MKSVIQFLIVGSLTLSLLTGCSNMLFDNDLSNCKEELPVSIIATIDNAATRANVMTRADGVVTDGVTSPWSPEQVEAEEYERTISHVFLFVYKKGETTPHKVFFYHAGENPLAGLQGDVKADIRPLKIPDDNPNPTSIQMELELLPGRYNFVMLVNSKAALEEMMSEKKITQPELLQEENTILTSDDLTKDNREYLPMVGQRELYVPDNISGSEGNGGYELTPEIKLERVHARVEFYLTTANEAGEYLSPILPRSKVTSLTLENEQKIYTVMPSAEDYTVTGEGQPNPIRTKALTKAEARTDRGSFHQGVGESSDDQIGLYENRLLPYTYGSTEKKFIYVAPSTLAKTKGECLSVLFKVKFIGDSEDTVYKIPLTNVGNNLTGNQEYVTRRNTIYRLNAKLIGRELIVLDYKVIGWTNQDVDIPW